MASAKIRNPKSEIRVRTNRLGLMLCAVCLLLTGCAGPRTMLMQQVRTQLVASDYGKAFETYKLKVKSTQRVDELLNLGLLALESGDFATAQSALSQADNLAEDRLTKSLSREAAGLAVSDRVRAYQGTTMDKALIHYYRALAFLGQNDVSSAVVEGRRIATYLEVSARESKHTFKDDAYLQWFSGSLYESFGQVNDAWISYKRARELYADFYGVPAPSYLCPVTLAAARSVGHDESETELAKLCPDAAASLKPGYGRVVVICEAGIAPPILEQNLVFPIFTSDNTNWADDEARWRYADEVSHRGDGYNYGNNTKLKYLLRVAMPYYSDDYRGTSVASVVIRGTDSAEVRAELAENMGAMLRQDLKDRYPSILVRAIVRAIIKYSAKEAAEQAGDKQDKVLGSILGAAVNAAGALSEAADTRSWETLPDRVYAADFQLPPGEHTLRALFQDAAGTALYRHDFPAVTVNAGEIVFLRVRNTQ